MTHVREGTPVTRPSLGVAMKTRTLLLLAVTCGLAILLAGTAQLLRSRTQDDASRRSCSATRGAAGDGPWWSTVRPRRAARSR